MVWVCFQQFRPCGMLQWSEITHRGGLSRETSNERAGIFTEIDYSKENLKQKMYLIAPAGDKGKNQAESLSTSMRVSLHFFLLVFLFFTPIFFSLLVLSFIPFLLSFFFQARVVLPASHPPRPHLKQNHYKRVHLIASVKNQNLLGQ